MPLTILGACLMRCMKFVHSDATNSFKAVASSPMLRLLLVGMLIQFEDGWIYISSGSFGLEKI
eukprot:snap_masked-scaffold_31-processed-gene-3.28-mRNA-1 protein AED:1.00 eAED:1.00 QI:0/-1/0/0/-1/1/1/0/62